METSKPSKGVMREIFRAEFINYHYQHKGNQAIINWAIFRTLGTITSPF